MHCRSATVIENHCKELAKTHFEQTSDHGAMYISSALLRAFSIELAFKSLINAERSERKSGHDLQAIFNELTADSQHDIEAAAQEHLARPFQEVLTEISKVFVDWRYVHEKFGEEASISVLRFDTDEMKAIAHAVMHVLDARIKSRA